MNVKKTMLYDKDILIDVNSKLYLLYINITKKINRTMVYIILNALLIILFTFNVIKIHENISILGINISSSLWIILLLLSFIIVYFYFSLLHYFSIVDHIMDRIENNYKLSPPKNNDILYHYNIYKKDNNKKVNLLQNTSLLHKLSQPLYYIGDNLFENIIMRSLQVIFNLFFLLCPIIVLGMALIKIGLIVGFSWWLIVIFLILFLLSISNLMIFLYKTGFLKN